MPEAPTPAILPATDKPPVYGPVYSNGQNPKKNVPVRPMVLGIGILGIVIVGSILFAVIRPKQLSVTPSVSPTATPAPTPIRTLSPFATQSAFLQFEQAVNALPTAISGTTISDQSLNPPTVNLPLGFQK